jgi:hypothetical protein
MAYYNSRAVNPVPPVTFGAPFPDLGGGDIWSGEDRHHNISLPTTSLSDMPIWPGTRVRTADGRMWCYVRAAANLVEGETTLQSALVHVDTVSSSDDLLSITEASAGWTANAYLGDYVYVDDGTGKGQTRRIVANTTDTLYLDRPLATALAVADSDIDIIRPYNVVQGSTTATIHTPGISSVIRSGDTYAITSGNFGWIQVAGWCDKTKAAAAVAYGALCVQLTAAGRFGAATPGTNGEFGFGICQGVAAAAGDLAPVMLTNCSLGVH